MEKTANTILFAGLFLALMISGVLAQPSVYDVAGTAKLNGNPVSPGTLIIARDSQGNQKGTFTVATQGVYGIMHIEGDDPNSTGEAISFFINGVEAQQTLSWQPFGYDPSFFLSACDLSTYSIVAQTDSGQYNPGQSMAITGYLMNSQCSLEPGRTVAYSVPDTAMMGQIQTNGSGYFSALVTIPSDTPLGGYTLWASFPPGANQTVYSTVNFTVVQATQPQPPSGGGGTTFTSGGGGCSPNWTCSSFSECQPNGTQSRVCTDKNNCSTAAGKPAETQACVYTSPAQAGECSPGSKVCSGSDLMECSSESKWVKSKTCDFGCSGNACLEGPGAGKEAEAPKPESGAPVVGLFLLEPTAWPYWIAIIFVIAMLAWYLLGKRKKKQKQ